MSDRDEFHIPAPISEELFVWKFLIGAKAVPDPANPDTEWFGCVALVIARDEVAAREQLRKFAEYNGAIDGWLKLAKVTKIPLREGAVLTWMA